MEAARIRELQRYAEAARQIRGWELEYEPEYSAPGPPWDYEARAASLARGARRILDLDLGTGGGEVLSRVLGAPSAAASVPPALPSSPFVVATEAYAPNTPVAAQRLRGRARVVHASSLALPIEAASFDAVFSRHEEIEPAEVARVLMHGGRFLTQQVAPNLWCELRRIFPDMTVFPDHFRLYRAGLRDAGMIVTDQREFQRSVRFRELGRLVYHLVAAPWTIPGFSVRTHLAGLERLDEQTRADDGLVLREGFYLLEARAP